MSPQARPVAPPRPARRAGLLLLLGALFLGFSALGVWQLQRLHWKHALIARVDSRIHAAAAAPPARQRWPDITAQSDEYRRIRLRGRYLQGRDLRVDALTALGPGSWVLSPLQTAGGIVLINRGFVPGDATAAPAPAGSVQLEGLLRISEPGGRVLRPNDPARGRWYSRDVAAIARALGLRDVAPYFIDADAAGSGWPRGGMTVVQFRDHHLQYALTWFALALLALHAGWRLLSMPTGLRQDAEHDPAIPGR